LGGKPPTFKFNRLSRAVRVDLLEFSVSPDLILGPCPERWTYFQVLAEADAHSAAGVHVEREGPGLAALRPIPT